MKKIIVLLVLFVVVILFFVFDFGQYLTLDHIKAHQQVLDQYYVENRVVTLIGFFVFVRIDACANIRLTNRRVMN